MKANRLHKPSNIRFHPAVTGDLNLLSKRFGVTKSDLVRNAVKEKIAEWHKSDSVVFKGAANG